MRSVGAGEERRNAQQGLTKSRFGHTRRRDNRKSYAVDRPVQDVCISAVTLAELQFGVAMSRLDEQDGAALGIFLRHIQVLEFPAKAAAHYGQVRAALHWRGVRIGPNELLIAAHARCAKMTLVTRRTRELKNVPEMLAESWMK